jgi:membrane protein implicated in regulation of membrane protease activity
MTFRIVINGHEVTNPFIKFSLVLGAMLVTGLVIAAVVFFLLPLLGITVVASITFVLVVVAGTVIAAFVLALFAILYAIIRGSFHLSVEQRQRKLPDRTRK